MQFNCTAVSCVRQISGKKSYINYQIKETCPAFKSGECTYPDKEIKGRSKNEMECNGSTGIAR